MKSSPSHSSHPLLDIFVSIIIPSIILMKLSREDSLGPLWALVIALAFPLAWGLKEFITEKKWNFVAALGLGSTLLTGGIGVMHIDSKWLAVKEAAIPGIIGIAVWVSAYFRHPFVRALLFNPMIVDVEKVSLILAEKGATAAFEKSMTRATYYLGGTFFFSSAMNFILAKLIVRSPAGSAAFNEELGRLTLVSYPGIALPSMIMMIAVIFFIFHRIKKLTGLSLEDLLLQKQSRKG